MDIYQTEEQQVDAIKKYWKDNGTAIIAGLFIGFGSFIGYNLYKDNQLEQELATSEAYQLVVESAGKEGDVYTKKGETFIAENGDSSYSTLTALSLAKKAASDKDWPQVEKFLVIAIEKASEAGIKGIATLRLARVQIQQEQFEKALNTLATPLPDSFKAAVEETKGDAFMKQGKTELARSAYQAAIEAQGEGASRAVKMKLSDLAEVANIK